MTLTIKQGFKRLTKTRGWYKKCTEGILPLNPSTATTLKQAFKNGKLSTDRMIEVLKSARYKITEATCQPPDEKV